MYSFFYQTQWEKHLLTVPRVNLVSHIKNMSLPPHMWESREHSRFPKCLLLNIGI